MVLAFAIIWRETCVSASQLYVKSGQSLRGIAGPLSAGRLVYRDREGDT
jgi:hypothetical protein